jgi:hypothetical protein
MEVNMRRCLAISLFVLTGLFLASYVHADDPLPIPPFLPQSQYMFVQSAPVVVSGEGWLTETQMGVYSYHLNGTASLRFDLSPMHLTAGYYRLGLVVRTGILWSYPTGQIGQYSLSLQDANQSVTSLGSVQLVPVSSDSAYLEAGEENSWANWYGVVQTTATQVHLNGDESLIIDNASGHGGVVAVWVQPISMALATPSLTMPAVPVGSVVLLTQVDNNTTVNGTTWVSDSALGYVSQHMHGTSELMYDLTGMHLPSGFYQLGLLARTGTLWNDPTNQISEYRLHLMDTAGLQTSLGSLQLPLNSTVDDLVRSGGEENSWANWFGVVESQSSATYLDGNEKLLVENLDGHGGVIGIWAQPTPMNDPTQIIPRCPAGSSFMYAQTLQEVTSGSAWIFDSKLDAQCYFMDQDSSLTFDLSSLQLSPGYYRIGFLGRTGNNWDAPTNHVALYQMQLIDRQSQTISLGTAKLPDEITSIDLVRADGVENSWANWYGLMEASSMSTSLQGNEKLVIHNTQDHGGVMAIWVKRVTSLNAVGITLQTQVDNNAFIAGQTPQIHIQVDCPENFPTTNAWIVLQCYDLLTQQTQPDASLTVYQPVTLVGGQTTQLTVNYAQTPGIYHVRAILVEHDGDVPADNARFARCDFAYTPAKLAMDLPEDWPLGAHVTGTIPPLPGFKYYRFFANWPVVNPDQGVYDWTEFDTVFNQVRQVGGNLFVAGDGIPLWTCSLGKVGYAWMPNATAYPPDSWQYLYDYLTAVIQRYEDPAGTLAAMESLNEANTSDRWQGTDLQLVEMAQTFRQAIQTANHPIQLVGIAASAGIQDNYVNNIIGAGILPQVDAVSAHWYEELLSYEPVPPINSIPKHTDMLSVPMAAAGHDLPMIDSESGLDFVNRVDGFLPSQQAVNESYEADPGFDSVHPWLVDGTWRKASERRAAATYVEGAVMLMSLHVMRTFYFTQLNFLIDNTPTLPWVALGQLGHHLDGVDYSQIQALPAIVTGSTQQDADRMALAYLIGQSGQKRIIVAWAYIRDTTVGRAKLWQPWLEPVEIQITTTLPSGQFSDLYNRVTQTVNNQNGKLIINCGEEPAFITIE